MKLCHQTPKPAFMFRMVDYGHQYNTVDSGELVGHLYAYVNHYKDKDMGGNNDELLIMKTLTLMGILWDGEIG